VSTILSSPELTVQWKVELKMMTDRIAQMRQLLRSECEKAKAPGSWEFVTSQYGMFAMTPLTPEQCERLAVEFHIYMTYVC
jgi:aspartate/tyrosine/aromatic aminotransferase